MSGALRYQRATLSGPDPVAFTLTDIVDEVAGDCRCNLAPLICLGAEAVGYSPSNASEVQVRVKTRSRRSVNR